MNLVEQMMKQLLAGDTLGQLADAAGAGQDDTKKAISAAVPALLSGLGSLASKPEGANKLWSTLKSVDDNAISDLGGMLSGGKSDQVAKTGTSILESLFGKGMIAALISALASFLGGKTALVTKLLPMLAPFLIGMIGKQVKSGGLDLGGLTKLILGQKGNIAAAMPQGLLSSLTGVQGLGDLTGFAKGAAASGRWSDEGGGCHGDSSGRRGHLPTQMAVAFVGVGRHPVGRLVADEPSEGRSETGSSGARCDTSGCCSGTRDHDGKDGCGRDLPRHRRAYQVFCGFV